MRNEKSFVSFTPYSDEETKKNIKIKIDATAGTVLDSEELAQEMAEHYSNDYKKENYNVVELEKNNEEIKAIEMAQKGFDKYFDYLKLPRIKIDPNLIHILTKEEFDKSINSIYQTKAGGKFSYGHVYCIRDKFSSFLHKLVHELVHNSSYYYLDINSSSDKTSVKMRQSGLTYTNNNEEHLFIGLNEATTELITLEILKIISDGNSFKKEENDELINPVSYYPQILVLEGLLDEIAGEDKEFKNTVMINIYKANYNGNYDFLKEFEKRHNGSIKILREMKEGNESALDASKKLKLKKIQKIIEQLIEKELKF